MKAAVTLLVDNVVIAGIDEIVEARTKVWKPFRELTPNEAREVKSLGRNKGIAAAQALLDSILKREKKPSRSAIVEEALREYLAKLQLELKSPSKKDGVK